MCKPQKVLSQKTEIKDNFKNLSFFRWGGGLLWTASHNNIYHKNGLFLKKINTKGGGGAWEVIEFPGQGHWERTSGNCQGPSN